MNRRAAIPLVAGLVIGLVAVKLVMDFVKKAQGSQQSQQKFTLVQAKQDIKAYEKIELEMVQAVETTDSVLAPQAERMGSIETVVGRVAMKGIPQNAPILKSMLAPEGTPEGIEGRIPKGYRAVAVKIDEATSAGYNLQPGDWVDVIVVMDVETGVRGKKDTLAEVILQRVQIAAIGQGTNEQADAAGGKMKPAKSATILVKHEDAPKLHLAGTRGKITLVLRGSEDKNNNEPATAYGNDIMARLTGERVAEATPNHDPVPPVEPEKPKSPPHTVLVFRSTAQGNMPAAAERVTFENAQSWKLLEVGMGTPTGMGAILKGARSGHDSGGNPNGVSANQAEPQQDPDRAEKANETNEKYDADEE
jgi:pilus assembly protein CpaB